MKRDDAGRRVQRARAMLGVLAVLAAPPLLRAQPAQAIIDSAAQARSAFRAASLAPTIQETIVLLRRAAHAWPTQPAYWEAVARMGARASDTAAVREAIDALADLHAGPVVLSDTAVKRLTHTPAIAHALARATRNSVVRKTGRVVATLADSTIFAEGVDADERTGILYVASIRHRTVFAVHPEGTVRDLRVSVNARVGAVLGVRVARDGRTLYATTAGLRTMRGYTAADSSIAAVIQVRIADGTVVRRWDLPVDGRPHLLGDLAITEDGTVFATDSFSPVLFRLNPGADSLEAIRHPLFRSLQGVAPIPGGEQLVVADYSHGLLRIDLASHAVTRIGDAPGSTSLGIDGLVWYDRGVIAVQNGIVPARIAHFVLDATRERVLTLHELDRQPAIADEPTIGTLWRGGFVYVANSQWEKYEENGVRRLGTVLRPTVLMCVPLTVASTQIGTATGRNGTRSTTSAPPPARTCNVSEAASP